MKWQTPNQPRERGSMQSESLAENGEASTLTSLWRGLEVDRYRGVNLCWAASGTKGFVAPE
jgi:hypothetical protein